MQKLISLVLSFFICVPVVHARMYIQHGQCLQSVVNRANQSIQQASTELRLPYSGINDRCLDSIVEAIRVNKHLVRLYLGHNGLTDNSATSLSVLFNMNRSLQGVDLSSNYLTSKGLNQVIHSLINNDSLTFLYMRNMQLDLSSIAAIAQLLAKSHSLRNIDLSLNPLGRYGIETFESNLGDQGSQVESLSLFSANLTGEGDVISSLIKTMPQLKWLDLGANQLSHSDFEHILEALSENGSIEGLDLSFNRLDDQDMELFAQVLPKLPQLVRLGLGHNQVSDKGLRTLAKVLVRLPNLHQISLESNLLTDSSIAVFDQMLKESKSLSNIISVNNKLTKDFIRNFSISQQYEDKFVVVARKQEDSIIYDDNHKPIL